MSITVCLSADSIGYPEGGGHLWVYLNWALGLRALGCEIIWLEGISLKSPIEVIQKNIAALKCRLQPYDLSDRVALCSRSGEPLPENFTQGCLNFDEAADADLLLNLRYGTAAITVERFRRSALIDIDPGLLQTWISKGHLEVAEHDVYFTTGETVGKPGSRIPDAGLKWHYTPPCIALEWWPVCLATNGSGFTTVSHWFADEWIKDADGVYSNDKRSGFLPYLTLPLQTTQPLELAICIGANEDEEVAVLRRQGWRVRKAAEVASTPMSYQHYIQQSRGEFSCAKPSCSRLQNAWISDRTLCYLASGKPAIVQHTGASKFLPDAAGLFRFRDLEEAAHLLEVAASDYDTHCRLARSLAENYFDARKVVAQVLERALN